MSNSRERIALNLNAVKEQGEKNVNLKLGRYEDINTDQNALIQQAQSVLSDIVAISNRLLPIAGKLANNEREALVLSAKAKELGITDLVSKFDSIGKNKISASVTKASQDVANTAKSYKL